MIEFVVAPFDHRYPVPVLEVKTTFPPVQKVKGPLAEIVGVGADPTVTGVATDVEEHPLL